MIYEHQAFALLHDPAQIVAALDKFSLDGWELLHAGNTTAQLSALDPRQLPALLCIWRRAKQETTGVANVLTAP